MDAQKEQEEKLREAACIGDEDTIRSLLENGVSVNSQHTMNGWTSLHWAVKRGHVTVISRLLQGGASADMKTVKGETAADLATDPAVQKMLGGAGEVNGNTAQSELAITPNYLRHPPFPFTSSSGSQMPSKPQTDNAHLTNHVNRTTAYHAHQPAIEDELVVKARLAGTGDPDFIEVELPYTNLSYDNLLTTLAKELNVDKRAVQKVRKLPNTIIRKDKDVKRLTDFQEIEIILTTYAVSQHSRNCGGPTPRHIDVVY